MSASNEKKIKKQNAADEKAREEQNRRRGIIIGVVIVLVAAVAAIVYNTRLFGLGYRSFTAVKVGDTGYTAAELNVFYSNAYNNLYSSYQSMYGDYMSYFVDTDGDEWKAQVYQQTLDNMRSVTALYDDATAHGYTLTEADRATVDEQLASLEIYAAAYGYSRDAYISAMYGAGVDAKTLEKVMTRMVVAQSWSASVQDGMTYSQETLDSYYAEHADEYDYIDYYYYTVGTDDEAFADIEDEDAKTAAAHDAAAAIAEAADEDAFKAAIEAFKEDAAPGEQYLQGSSLDSSYSEWLLDGARRSGDTTVIDGDSGSTALLFMYRDGNDYNLQSMRHILIETEADEETNEYTEEAAEAAKARVEEIYAEWQEDPTEEHFAELANEYSEDSGSNENGGLYENIYHKQMVTNINDYLFDPARAPGDTAVLFGESGYYQGWHLVYYVGEGPVYKDYLAENALRSADYGDYIEALTTPYEITVSDGTVNWCASDNIRAGKAALAAQEAEDALWGDGGATE